VEKLWPHSHVQLGFISISTEPTTEEKEKLYTLPVNLISRQADIHTNVFWVDKSKQQCQCHILSVRGHEWRHPTPSSSSVLISRHSLCIPHLTCGIKTGEGVEVNQFLLKITTASLAFRMSDSVGWFVWQKYFLSSLVLHWQTTSN